MTRDELLRAIARGMMQVRFEGGFCNRMPVLNSDPDFDDLPYSQFDMVEEEQGECSAAEVLALADAALKVVEEYLLKLGSHRH